MKKALFLLVFFIFSAPFAVAQSIDRPHVELFGGYSVLRTNYRVERPDTFDLVLVAFEGKQTLNGFNVSATVYLTKGFGLMGDFSGHFTTNSLPDPLGGNIETRIRVFNTLGGMQYKFRSKGRVTPFMHSLAGVADTRSILSVPSLSSTETASSTDFALAIGGGVDVRINDQVGLRVFQADYNPIFLSHGNELGFGKSRADNVRFSFGVVFK